jgi:hypothetical protein
MSQKNERSVIIGTCSICGFPIIEGDKPDKHSNPTTCRINILSERRRDVEKLSCKGQK